MRSVNAGSTHNRFHLTVFGFVREHEKDESINVAAMIKYLCLEYYLLKEEWTSCWAQYPFHWILKNGTNSLADDWSKRTMFDLGQSIGYKPDSGPTIQADILQINTNDSGQVTKIFLSFERLDTNHKPYGWVTVPNERLCAPNFIAPSHWEAVSGTFPIDTSDESIAEYRWSFQFIRLQPIKIGLHRQGTPINSSSIFPNLYNEMLYFKRPHHYLKSGDIFHVVLDLIACCVRVEIGKVRYSSKKHKQMKWTLGKSKRAHFLVIDYHAYSGPRRKINREFRIEDSNKILKFKEFSIKQKSQKMSQDSSK